jgi:hypothetical protein
MILVGFVVSALPDLVAVGSTPSVFQVPWVLLLGRQGFGTQWRDLDSEAPDTRSTIRLSRSTTTLAVACRTGCPNSDADCSETLGE